MFYWKHDDDGGHCMNTIAADVFAEQQGMFRPTGSRTWHIGRFWLSGQVGDDATLCGHWKADADWDLDVIVPPNDNNTCKVCLALQAGTWAEQTTETRKNRRGWRSAPAPITEGS